MSVPFKLHPHRIILLLGGGGGTTQGYIMESTGRYLIYLLSVCCSRGGGGGGTTQKYIMHKDTLWRVQHIDICVVQVVVVVVAMWCWWREFVLHSSPVDRGESLTWLDWK